MKKMKTLRTLLVIAIAIFGSVSSSFAQLGQGLAATTATAGGTVLTPITIALGTNLEFGTIVTSVAGGTVAVPTSGTATYTGVSVFTGAGAVTPTAATFNVSGNYSTTFATAVTSWPTVVTHTDGSTTMAIGAHVDNFDTTLDGTGVAHLKIGATLTLGGTQKAGRYTSDPFTVTVNYN